MLRTPTAPDMAENIMRIDGRSITDIFNYCPLSEVCHVPDGCTRWEAKRFDGCPQFRHYLKLPKVVAYVVERAVGG